MPVTIPLPVPTLAMLVAALLHEPPLLRSLNTDVEPLQIFAFPVMVAGIVFTVIVLLAVQPVGNAYVMLDVPVDILVTLP